jgi:DNA polymerase-3 subunit delta'
LKFSPPPAEQTAAWLVERAGVGAGEATELATMAGGAPGRAWRLASAGAIEADAAARSLLAALPNTDPAAMLALVDGFRSAQGAERFALILDRMAKRVHAKASARALAGEADLDRWAEAFELLAGLPGQVEAVNLDRGDAFFTALARLKAAAAAC